MNNYNKFLSDRTPLSGSSTHGIELKENKGRRWNSYKA
jgi:hypothetical protein